MPDDEFLLADAIEHSNPKVGEAGAHSPGKVETGNHSPGKVEAGSLTPPGDSHPPLYDVAVLNHDYEGKPTEEEMKTLRRVPGGVPMVAYMLCAVEFCERASYYGE
jgi:hypothetical protein